MAMDSRCGCSTSLAAPPSVWALLTFALTTVLCLALDSSFGCERFDISHIHKSFIRHYERLHRRSRGPSLLRIARQGLVSSGCLVRGLLAFAGQGTWITHLSFSLQSKARASDPDTRTTSVAHVHSQEMGRHFVPSTSLQRLVYRYHKPRL